jgi:hypothetical protein
MLRTRSDSPPPRKTDDSIRDRAAVSLVVGSLLLSDTWVTTISATGSPRIATPPSTRPALPVDAYSGHLAPVAASRRDQPQLKAGGIGPRAGLEAFWTEL